jgi:hypothetical protein
MISSYLNKVDLTEKLEIGEKKLIDPKLTLISMVIPSRNAIF